MKLNYLLLLFLVAGNAIAQHEAETDSGSMRQADTLNIFDAFKKGKTTGHFRYFFMATNNKKGLSDYYANAIGGGLKYETAVFHKLQFGVGGFFIYNIGSSDLSKEDPATLQPNRYELSLFDLEDPHNTHDMDRLEELYIRYKGKGGEMVIGKQLIKTPFINPQDSRMRPTEVEGLYGNISLEKNWNVEGGWLYGISPRSTVNWYSVARSIGINSQGVNVDGSLGNYRNNIHSKGIGLLGVTYKTMKGLQVKVYDQLVENVFNSTLFQTNYEQGERYSKAKVAFQYIRQDAIKSGGNADPSKTYFDKANKVNIYGIQLGLEKGSWETSLNYTRIGKSGRFTMPREWGTEPLFTYLSRERNEGYGNVNAVMAKVKGTVASDKLKLELGYGHYYLPDIGQGELNKYRMPSYRHIKGLADYTFSGALKGLDVALLFIYKGQLTNQELNPRYVINKVDMASYNVIMSYHF